MVTPSPPETEQCIGVIVGPTASGKSELALDVAENQSAEIISADAYQIYRGLDIGTAKMSMQARQGVRHHLIDVAAPSREVTVAQFQSWAREAIADCQDRRVVPLIAGGSSLYIRAIIDDFSFPGTDPDIRARWQRELDRIGPQRLHDVLAERDGEAARMILASNGRRIVRALEVLELTQAPFQAQLPRHQSVYHDVRIIGIDIDRDLLDRRIENRVRQMWDNGWVSEVAGLANQGFDDWPTSSRALGYRHVLAYVRGDLDRDSAISSIVKATQRFARRQQRMFAQDPRVVWLRHDASDLVARAVRILST